MRLLIALIMMAIFLGSGSSQASATGGHDSTTPPAETMSGGPLAGSGKSGIDMPALMAPVSVDGVLQYYVYLSIRLQLSGDSQKDLVLERIPYIQDAFLREVHRASIAVVGDPQTVDGHGLTERFLSITEKVVGPGVITGIEFRNMVRHTGS